MCIISVQGKSKKSILHYSQGTLHLDSYLEYTQ